MKQLNRASSGRTQERPLKVLQFGGGNFLRAFVDWMIHRLNQDAGFAGDVVLVKPTERGDYADLRRQEGLFHVVLRGIQGGQFKEEHTLVDSVRRIIHPYREWEAFLASAETDTIRYIVSNTTEAGITFRESDRFEDHPPAEFPAKLTHWLYRRFRHFGGAADKGCVLLPCELIESNGDALRDGILRYAEYWQLPAAFSDWIRQHHIFCNTLVDRIVSGYPEAEEARALQQSLGFADSLLVAGEYYHSWIIQGPAALAAEMGFDRTDLNVRFVDDLRPHRLIKVRMLNGAHTAMVPVGYLSGMRSVREVMEEPHLGNFVRQILQLEIMPTLDLPVEELSAFAEAVTDRFLNPSIHHQLISIALNSTTKFRTRLLPSLLAYQEQKGALPPRIVLALAALIVFYRGEWEGKTIALQDDEERIRFFHRLWQEQPQPIAISRAVLEQEAWWGTDLNRIPGLSDRLAHYLDMIAQQGMYNTLLQLQ